MRSAFGAIKEWAEQLKWTTGTIWWSAVVGVGIAAFIIFAFVYVPPPGYAIGLLAALAVVMTLRNPTGDEKALWILGTFMLMVIEIFAITRDRQKQESDFKVMLTDVEDSIKTQTGGDSFAFLTLTEEPAYVTFNNIPHPQVPYFIVSFTSHGKYPLRDIRATVMDDERRLQAMQEYNKNPTGNWIAAINAADSYYHLPYLRPQSAEAPGGDVETVGAYPISQATSKRLSISFGSLNGYWIETLHLGVVNGHWHQCLSVVGPTVKQFNEPFIWCDSNYPEGRALAERDWPKPPVRPVAP